MNFSVLLSVYRKENPKYLKQSIDSIFTQTVPPTEIVMVEDGPLTDELYKVLDGYKKDPRWKAVPLTENVGLGKALNAGLEACSYELVARMDTDDIAKPERFEKQLAAFAADPELSLCGTQAAEFRDTPENVTAHKKVPLTDEEIRQYARKRNPFNHPTVMYKKSEVLRAGSYQHAMWFEDYYLWARMLAQGSKTRNLPEELLWFRAGEDMRLQVCEECGFGKAQDLEAGRVRVRGLSGLRRGAGRSGADAQRIAAAVLSEIPAEGRKR